MILYLSSIKNNNLLDFMGENEQIPVKKMVGNFILKQFIIYDMRSFTHFTDLVLDRSACGDDDETFIAAIEEFQTMYQVRITVIQEQIDKSGFLFTSLIECGVGNIVSATEIHAIQNELSECLSEDGMKKYNTKERKRGELEAVQYDFHCTNIRIGILSSQSRLGATTAAIGLCSWLAKVGASAKYIQANQSGHLEFLIGSYEMEKKNGNYFYEGVSYQLKESDEETNFIVYDIGAKTAELSEPAIDVFVYLCGSKPYELKQTMQSYEQLKGKKAYLIFAFVADTMRQEFIDAFTNEFHQVLFLEYQPELTDSSSNSETYRHLISDYITGG